MKNKIKTIASILFIIVISLNVLCFTGCDRNRMINYYSDDSNYKIYIGKLNDISLNILTVSDIKEENQQEILFLYDNYRIIDESVEVLKANGFFEEVSVGDEIRIKIGLMVWGDGYVIPIAAIWCNDKCYLDFETGKKHILAYVSE